MFNDATVLKELLFALKKIGTTLLANPVRDLINNYLSRPRIAFFSHAQTSEENLRCRVANAIVLDNTRNYNCDKD